MNGMEKRIYVILAGLVHSPIKGPVIQPPGRQLAQAVHVARRVEDQEFRDRLWPYVGMKLTKRTVFDCSKDVVYTTIALQARDDNELEHLAILLTKEEIEYKVFLDENDFSYGKDVKVFTALATMPVEPVDVQGILDYLPLWGKV